MKCCEFDHSKTSDIVPHCWSNFVKLQTRKKTWKINLL